MRIIFVNRFYWPDEPATAQLLTDLAEALGARGYDIAVIASAPSGRMLRRIEQRHGVEVRRVRGTRWGRHSLLGRIVDFATFAFGMLIQLFSCVRRGDVIVAMTDPPLLAISVWPVAQFKRARLVHWIQDIYPEVALALSSGLALRAAGALMQPIRNFVWRQSAACIAVGNDLVTLVRRSGVAEEIVRCIPNWAPAGLDAQLPGATDQLRSEWELTGKFVLIYAGNLGRVHDLAPVLELAEHLRNDSRFALVFVGDGAQRAELERNARDRRLGNVQFRAPQPRARLGAVLALGDVHFVTLRVDCEATVFPSKLYGIAAVGRPIVFIGPNLCELARLVREHRLGLTRTREEMSALAGDLRLLADDEAARKNFAEAAITFSRREGQLDHAVAAWEHVLTGNSLAAPNPRRVT